MGHVKPGHSLNLFIEMSSHLRFGKTSSWEKIDTFLILLFDKFSLVSLVRLVSVATSARPLFEKSTTVTSLISSAAFIKFSNS